MTSVDLVKIKKSKTWTQCKAYILSLEIKTIMSHNIFKQHIKMSSNFCFKGRWEYSLKQKHDGNHVFISLWAILDVIMKFKIIISTR